MSKATPAPPCAKPAPTPAELRELASLFLKLGFTSFGGPVAHIAMMENEVVTRRKWMTHQQFLDMLGATNLLPGPNSTEMALHIGQTRAGWRGLLIAGFCFICPAVVIILVLAVLYARYGTVPQAQWLLFGVQPVVTAIVVQALWKFASSAVKDRWTAFLAITAAALAFAGTAKLIPIGEVTIIIGAALIGLATGFLNEKKHPREKAAAEPVADDEPTSKMPLLLLGAAPVLTISPTVMGLFWVFLKIGSILYGSGYVLLAFLRADLVERLHWLTDKQLVDAIAIGQATPGPLFTTATFVGYQIAGYAGAFAATIGIFLPSFIFVALLSVVMEKLQTSRVMRSFLDAVNAASFALMAVVSLQIARFAIIDPLPNLLPVVLFAISLLLLLRTRLNSMWLVSGGALVGLVWYLFSG